MTKSTSAAAGLLALLLATACGSASVDDTTPSSVDPSTAAGGQGDQNLASGTGSTGSTGSQAKPQPQTQPSGARPQGGAEGDFAPAPAGDPASGDPAAAPTAPADPSAPPSAERQVVAKLGLGSSFLIGLGNDSAGNNASQTHAYALPHKVDIHYMYLSGLDWPEWNAPTGDYVTQHANAAKSRGIVPMFTLYQAASYGENNLGVFNTTEFMTKYWRGVKVMLQRLGEFDSPVVVHLEPDLWGYTQQHAELPSGTPMKVGSLVPECTDLPSDVSGMARCMIRLSRQLAPKAVVGLSASSFGAFTNGYSDPTRIANYMNAIGANEADIVVLETLDRDAGCFENGSDVNCKRGGKFYWDETNVAHPNFHDHLAWAKTVRTIVGKPLLWWQMPLGVPAGSAGYSSHYRDNRVKYLFSHVAEFAAAGGIGAAFGTGAGNQTDATTDGGQFKNAVTSYYTAPEALP